MPARLYSRGGMAFAMLILLLQLATVVQHASAVEFVVTNNAPDTDGGRRFDTFLNGMVTDWLTSSSEFCRGTAFSLGPVPDRPVIELLVEAGDPYAAWVVSGTPNVIHLSAPYVARTSPDDIKGLRREIRGVLYHEMAHVWQNGAMGEGSDIYAGVREGIADWVRLQSGYRAAHWTRQRGGTWWSGYQTTAFFLDWIQTSNPSNRHFVNQLNQKMGLEPWSNDFFRQITGTDVDQLWNAYQDSFN